MYFREISKFLIIISTLLSLSSCGHAPVIYGSQVYDKNSKKIDSLVFVYLNSKMKTTSYSTDVTLARNIDTGYTNFGNLLVQQAAEVFLSYDVRIVKPQSASSKLSGETMAQGEGSSTDKSQHTMLVYATGGKTTGNRHSVRVSYVFEVILLDMATGKPVWKASIDTSTWSGHDFILKYMPKTLYDEDYAKLLLQTIAGKMKDEGLI